MSKFLIVGKSHSPLPAKIEQHGSSWTLLKHSTINSGYSSKTPHTFYADLSSVETIQQALDKLEESFDGILNIYENYVPAVAQIGKILNLPAISEESARLCTNKFLMRTRFQEAPKKISPQFAWADSWENVARFADEHSFPLILKPVSLSKSLLVTKNHDLDELRDNFAAAMRDGPKVYQKYSPNQEPKFIIEEFLEGPIFSVDGFADINGVVEILDVVVDYETGFDIGYNDNFHYSRVIPSRLSEEDQLAIRETAKLGMEALGMSSSPGHCEIILTTEGPMLVEIGARNGGYRDRMHGLANGIDVYGAMMDLAQNKPLNISKQKDEGCAVLELFPRNRGLFVEVENETTLRNLDSFNELRIVPKVGEEIGRSSEGFKMAARIVLHNVNIAQFRKDLDYIKNNVTILTK